MRFLLPVGGVVDKRFGILTNYNHKAVPSGILDGMEWAGDAPVFGSKDFEPDKWLQWLKIMQPYRVSCLFVVCPDVVGDAAMTLVWFKTWRPRLNGWPVAFVAQDGQEDLDFPDHNSWSALFVGGSTEWKESKAAIEVIQRAQLLDKHIHIGRVNWGRRYRMFRILAGSEGFTCDGTRTRFEGADNTIRAWAGYQAQKPLFTI
jgi:hypothetical protein